MLPESGDRKLGAAREHGINQHFQHTLRRNQKNFSRLLWAERTGKRRKIVDKQAKHLKSSRTSNLREFSRKSLTSPSHALSTRGKKFSFERKTVEWVRKKVFHAPKYRQCVCARFFGKGIYSVLNNITEVLETSWWNEATPTLGWRCYDQILTAMSLSTASFFVFSVGKPQKNFFCRARRKVQDAVHWTVLIRNATAPGH